MSDINDINISNVDLNLLHIVAVVLEQGSATRAARALHVTQPAVSNALKRAREVFDDPLVTRTRYGLTPTPRGRALLPRLQAWLADARRMVEGEAGFDPSTRTFRLACVDALTLTLLRPILRILNARAPGARLRMVTLDRLIAEDGLARGQVDLLMGAPPTLGPALRSEVLFHDPMTCITRKGHPLTCGGLTLETFAALPHVELALFGAADDVVDRALSRHGLSRTVAVALPHFSAIPLAVAETDGVATVTERLARAAAATLPLDLHPPPLPLDPLEVRLVWHRRAEGDPAVAFLRAVVVEAAHTAPPM
ncbi:MAG: LysR family transcriptional regulator [Alphaproteobacteria bacterium]|nr:LysR family transcriptional regulator [Alphaproteobacteria bacterium]